MTQLYLPMHRMVIAINERFEPLHITRISEPKCDPARVGMIRIHRLMLDAIGAARVEGDTYRINSYAALKLLEHVAENEHRRHRIGELKREPSMGTIQRKWSEMFDNGGTDALLQIITDVINPASENPERRALANIAIRENPAWAQTRDMMMAWAFCNAFAQ